MPSTSKAIAAAYSVWPGSAYEVSSYSCQRTGSLEREHAVDRDRLVPEARQVVAVRVLEDRRDVRGRPDLRAFDVAQQVEPCDVVVVVVRGHDSLDVRHAVVAPQRPSDRAAAGAPSGRARASTRPEVVAPVDQQSGAAVRQERVARREARAVPQQVRRQRLPRPASHCSRSHGARPPAQSMSSLRRRERVARARPRDRRSARRATAAAGRAAWRARTAAAERSSRLALDAAVRPLGRGERPDLAAAVEEVAGERDTPAVELDEVGDRADGVARRRQREDVAPRRSGRVRYSVDRPGDRHRLEQREAVLAEVVVVVDRRATPSARSTRAKSSARRAAPRSGSPRRRRARKPLQLVAVVVRDEDVSDPARRRARPSRSSTRPLPKSTQHAPRGPRST